LGKGVSYCATCDAPLFRDRKVAIIGGSDSAAHSALLLSRYAKKVYIVYRKAELRCKPFLIDKIKEAGIEIINEAVPIEIDGNNFVNKLVIEKKGKKKKLEIDGVFIEIGNFPLSDLAKKLGAKLDEDGYVISDKEMKISDGVYAAGDVVSSKLKQIVVAAAQGAIAASSCYEYLKMKKRRKNEI
jgi:thioredoxin reductase (NADPH)